MSENNNTLLEKLDGLVARFEEVSTLITDPSVIADQKRYVKLTKEYKELGDIMKARGEYLQCLAGLEEAKAMMNESDPEMKEMAREEAAACEARIPELEEEIKPETFSACIRNIASAKVGSWKYRVPAKAHRADSRKSSAP